MADPIYEPIQLLYHPKVAMQLDLMHVGEGKEKYILTIGL